MFCKSLHQITELFSTILRKESEKLGERRAHFYTDRREPVNRLPSEVQGEEKTRLRSGGETTLDALRSTRFALRSLRLMLRFWNPVHISQAILQSLRYNQYLVNTGVFSNVAVFTENERKVLR